MTDQPYAKKSLGQHWLNDAATLEYICQAGNINTEDTVLEIGPGTGTLTRRLVNYAKQVVAVEYDKALAERLLAEKIAPNLQIINQDILSFDLTSLQPDYKVVANIPYYLTSNLIRVLSESTNRASRIVLLIQKEVAERVAAKPGDMSLLSVSAQFYWQVELGEIVPAKLFEPPPKVDSQIIILKKHPKPLFPGLVLGKHGKEREKSFFRIVKAGFSSRRKTLLNSLAGGLRTEKKDIQAVLDIAQISADLRAQALSIEQWHQLYLAVSNKNIL